jgi:hypothetical protein
VIAKAAWPRRIQVIFAIGKLDVEKARGQFVPQVLLASGEAFAHREVA